MEKEVYEICVPGSAEAEMLDDKLLDEIQKVRPFTQSEDVKYFVYRYRLDARRLSGNGLGEQVT